MRDIENRLRLVSEIEKLTYQSPDEVMTLMDEIKEYLSTHQSVEIKYHNINGTVSFNAIDKYETLILDISKITYKTSVKRFYLPASNADTNKDYFTVVMDNGDRILCPGSEYNKI